MADSFRVFHGDYSDVNISLRASLQNMDTVMSDLTRTLHSIGVATQGKATPLWEDQAAQWQTSYIDMQHLLGEHTGSSETVADIFVEGDNAGARIMG